jgi:ergothioneine biosynthesis protein EgtC
MCRFVLYLGDEILVSSLVTDPANSLIHQSFDSRERSEPLNGDGFGLAWYVPRLRPEAAQFRSVTPAWSNQNLRHLARITASGCVLAHVRAASPGLPVTETNTHPFVSGRYAFMHNGDVEGFLELKRALLDTLGAAAYAAIEGTTDSEHLFALFLDVLGGDPDGDGDAMERALEEALGRLLEIRRHLGVPGASYLNVAVSNGVEAVVTRLSDGAPDGPPSLHLHTGKLYACHDGAARLLEAEAGGHAVIVASEPLTEDPTWSVVPPQHLLRIRADRSVAIRPLGATSG